MTSPHTNEPTPTSSTSSTPHSLRNWLLTKTAPWIFFALVTYVFPTVFLGDAPSFLPGTLLLLGGFLIAFNDPIPQSIPRGKLIKRSIGTGMILLGTWVLLPSKPEAEMTWEPYSQEALQRAIDNGKPVLIDCYANWCGPCRRMDQNVFTKKIVVDALQTFVALRADFSNPQSQSAQEVGQKFRIQYFPTLIFLSPNGEEIRSLRLEGYEPATQFTERIKAAHNSH